MTHDIEQLRRALELSIVKKNSTDRAGTIAYSRSGRSYRGSLIESDTHLLNISPEQVALCMSTQKRDYAVERVITMVEHAPKDEAVSPINIKILIDYARRTGNTLAYTVLDAHGETFFETKNVRTVIPFYQPPDIILDRVSTAPPIEENSAEVDLAQTDIVPILKKYAKCGLERNFPTYNSASGYATAVITKNGKVYYSGQYSSFEKRTNIHSEAAAILTAFMDGNRDITHMALISTKYKKEPCEICGFCRQFIFEMATRFGLDIKIFCFALENDFFTKYTIDAYLPNAWASKQW